MLLTVKLLLHQTFIFVIFFLPNMFEIQARYNSIKYMAYVVSSWIDIVQVSLISAVNYGGSASLKVIFLWLI